MKHPKCQAFIGFSVNKNRLFLTDKNVVIFGDGIHIAFDLGAGLGLDLGHGLHAAFPIVGSVGFHGVDLKQISLHSLGNELGSKMGVTLFQNLDASGHMVFAFAGVEND